MNPFLTTLLRLSVVISGIEINRGQLIYLTVNIIIIAIIGIALTLWNVNNAKNN
tara:strand:+ start:505 stop:666 length:162 start_codon:yes stop_codon:yes gene_type:complete